jgi:HPt (histidine-containing phosphotransfer) domain-containing protein
VDLFVDVRVLDQLAGELEDPALVRAVVGTYLDELDGRLAEVRAALDADDPDALVRAAHALKSASRMVGAVALATPAAELEAAARAGSTAGAGERLAALEQAVPPVRAALGAW